nr:PREDICTED: uncharacterized protein LOC109040282 isoform X3 [Bemisia tabaci]
MTSLTLQLDNEQITKLFPKCKPRQRNCISTDVNLNNVQFRNFCGDDLCFPVLKMDSDLWQKRVNCGANMGGDEGGEAEEEECNSPNESSLGGDSNDEDDDEDSGRIVLTLKNRPSKTNTYKLRDSRIIQIAGGREVFSQSRSKSRRKSSMIDHSSNNKSSVASSSSSSGAGTSVWELRSRYSNLSNSGKTYKFPEQEVTETVFSSEIHSVFHPKPQQILSSQGGSVVFNDIDDTDFCAQRSTCPNELSSNLSPSPTPPPPPPLPSVSLSEKTSSFKASSRTPTNEPLSQLEYPEIYTQSKGSSDTDCSKVARIIGNLPIAEYEGSPRRYGLYQRSSSEKSNNCTGICQPLPTARSLLASPSAYLPRPGFPQRVMREDFCGSPSLALSPTKPNCNTSSAFDYLYEFSETRKVLEEFFKPALESNSEQPDKHFDNPNQFQELDYELRRHQGTNLCKSKEGNSYVGSRLAKPEESNSVGHSPRKPFNSTDLNKKFMSISREDLSQPDMLMQKPCCYLNLSADSTDCDSNCDSELSSIALSSLDIAERPLSGGSGGANLATGSSGDKLTYSSMPVVEDGLSSGHASDTDNNNPTTILMKRQITEIEREIVQRSTKISGNINNNNNCNTNNSNNNNNNICNSTINPKSSPEMKPKTPIITADDLDLQSLDPLGSVCTTLPSTPTEYGNYDRHHKDSSFTSQQLCDSGGVEAAIKDIRLTLQRTRTLPLPPPLSNDMIEENLETHQPVTPVWIPRKKSGQIVSGASGDEGGTDEADTDLETDRLLGQQRTDDQGFFDDEMNWKKPKSRISSRSLLNNSNNCASGDRTPASPLSSPLTPPTSNTNNMGKEKEGKKKARNKEVLIEGVLFRARYLGSTQLVCEGQPTKSTRMMQAEEAVSRIKALAPEGETQPNTEVDLFISTEKIMVLNTDLKEIMMDHALRTISYIADIGELVVLMARRRFIPHDVDDPPKINRTPKMICHVFESEEAQFIAQSIGQAFQVAYMEFLKANGIEDHSFVKEMDYQEVLNSQEIFGDELQMFARKELQKEVVVPKAKGEILGVVIVESGWGSMLPTVVIANLAPAGAAARCGQLNIGDQIIAVNGVSLVGLPLSTCQNYIKNSKTHTVVKLTVVPCAPVVEVKIKRPDTKYQLGFSVQNGVICSLLRGGIAERGGVRVGHRIIEINNQSVVAVPHEKIVNLLATSVGEILMKTMPTSMFRLLTGQETPVFI